MMISLDDNGPSPCRVSWLAGCEETCVDIVKPLILNYTIFFIANLSVKSNSREQTLSAFYPIIEYASVRGAWIQSKPSSLQWFLPKKNIYVKPG